MKIYVASSWRNPYFETVFGRIKTKFPHTYNFKESGFHWSTVIGKGWPESDIETFKQGLRHPIAEQRFIRDSTALEAASATILVLPCGRSAHLELGIAVAKKQFTAVYSYAQFEPELMYNYIDLITNDMEELIESLEEYENSRRGI